MADIKKIEIIERITDFNGAVIENTLTSWDHFYVKESVEDIFAYELEIYPRERRIRKKQKDIYLTYCEFEILYLLARNPGRVLEKNKYMTGFGESHILGIIA